MQSIYDFSLKDSYGNTHSLSEYREKALLLVNTATRCGLAPQFEELEALHQEFKDKGLVVIGFPCDQFAGQEPETNESMAQTCKVNFGVTFLLSEKIDVNGKNTHPLFKHLKKAAKSGLFGSGIKWNFTKFIVSKDGLAVTRHAPAVSPLSFRDEIISLLEQK